MKTEDIKSFKPINLFANLTAKKKHFHEIARVSFTSSFGDAISIRAKQTKTGILVDVVDAGDDHDVEYLDYRKEYSEIPTQGEVFNIITDMNTEEDSQPLLLALAEEHDLNTIDGILAYITITSNFYPDLPALFITYLKLNGLK